MKVFEVEEEERMGEAKWRWTCSRAEMVMRVDIEDMGGPGRGRCVRVLGSVSYVHY